MHHFSHKINACSQAIEKQVPAVPLPLDKHPHSISRYSLASASVQGNNDRSLCGTKASEQIGRGLCPGSVLNRMWDSGFGRARSRAFTLHDASSQGVEVVGRSFVAVYQEHQTQRHFCRDGVSVLIHFNQRCRRDHPPRTNERIMVYMPQSTIRLSGALRTQIGQCHHI